MSLCVCFFPSVRSETSTQTSPVLHIQLQAIIKAMGSPHLGGTEVEQGGGRVVLAHDVGLQIVAGLVVQPVQGAQVVWSVCGQNKAQRTQCTVDVNMKNIQIYQYEYLLS